MKRSDPITVDFETRAIDPRPAYPPHPVGVSLLFPGKKDALYLAWAHNTENNCSKQDAARVLKQVWGSGAPLLFHNAAFDLEVAREHFGLALPPWHMVEDTMFLLFLAEPTAQTLALKESADRILGMPPTEQADLRQWILDNIPGVKPSEWGRYISRAPGDLVGRYANGDTKRTRKLYDRLRKQVATQGMDAAYDRERRLLPHLLTNSCIGLRVDLPALKRAVPLYASALTTIDQWLFKRLRCDEFNLDSNDELVIRMLAAGVADEHKMLRTPKSKKLSTSKDSLDAGLVDPKMRAVLNYRGRLSTCLNTFMKPWLVQAAGTGLVYPHWHQVRAGHDARNENGARTGRIICTDPNLLNLAKSFEDRTDGYEHPGFINGLLELPLVRRYILPDKGEVFAHRDYNQQEFRVFGHYEDGPLKEAYVADPTLDMHNFVQGVVKDLLKRDVPRSPIKILNFGMLYGMGLDKTAKQLHTSVENARELKAAQRKAVPGINTMYTEMKQRARDNTPIRTWGGRLYYCEPPRMVNGSWRQFDYKLVNYLVQGSAADITKEAVIRYHEHPKRKDGRFLVTVYDEVNCSFPRGAVKPEMAALRDAMESIELDVFLKSDAKVGPNWAELKPYAD
jgi:DNA polymerase I-like protein with 3'-5' exonuclease and polymerase domains